MRKQIGEEPASLTSKDTVSLHTLSENTFKRDRGDVFFYNDAVDPKLLVYKIYYEEYKKEDLNSFLDIALKKVRADTFYKDLKQESRTFARILKELVLCKHQKAIERYAILIAGSKGRDSTTCFESSPLFAAVW